MRTLIVGDAIEIEGRTVAHINAGVLASHRDYLEDLVRAEPDDAAETVEAMEEACGTIETAVADATRGLDDVISEGGSPIKGLRALSDAMETIAKRERSNDGPAIVDLATEIGALVDSVVTWIETDARERDRLAKEVEAAASTGYTDEQARAKLPVVEAALAHANERVADLSHRLAEHDRDAEHARNAIKRVTSQSGADNLARSREIDALKAQNERQAAQIKLLQAGGGHKVSQAPAQPKHQMGFEAAAAQLYIHLHGQMNRLDAPTKKLVAAVAKTMA